MSKPPNTLPVVMVADRVKWAREQDLRYPGRLGLIFSPKYFHYPKGIPYAFDNGRFVCWDKKEPWDEGLFYKHLDRVAKIGYLPLWVVCPDTVANATKTFEEWQVWQPILKERGLRVALAVQDGMTVAQVKALQPQPEVIFVGGTTRFKWRTLVAWCKHFPWVHVGRVNTIHLLWKVHRAGAASSDGTRWFHYDRKEQLERYLYRSTRGLPERDRVAFPWLDPHAAG